VIVARGYGDKKLIFSPYDVQSLEITTDELFRINGHIIHILWLKRFIETKSPFTETMTLFWSSHFTSAFLTVFRPDLMLGQNALLRSLCLGNFRDLLREITLDGAMLVYLSGKDNVRGKPNQNYARELLELFTLGDGHYTEEDVNEASRALTGIQLIGEKGVWHDEYFDDTQKVFLWKLRPKEKSSAHYSIWMVVLQY
jgi:uncharacterized protein (DUF1800 family)